MNLKRMLGLDTLAEKYAYGHDPEFGYIAARRIPDRWVPTTCGYCSVGCGMFIGVKDGRAVSVRGNPDHPVNAGMLCPKGLCEHETIHADGRACYPLLRRDRRLQRVSWDDAIGTMATRFRDIQRKHGNDAVRRDQHRAAGHRGVLHARQAGAARLRHPQLRRQHDALHGQRGLRATSARSAATDLPARTKIWRRPTSFC